MNKVNCLLCGNELGYKNEHIKVVCEFCKKEYDSNVKCIKGHYVCDKCHSLPAYELIHTFCINSESQDPMEIAVTLMKNPAIKMHGPEHHFLVPAVLVSAYYNFKNDFNEKEKKIELAQKRAKNILGGFCGYYGSCGAAIGIGIFISLITNSNPLSKESWKLSNLVTAKSLKKIAKAGGPRCCKRNTFLALESASEFLVKHFKVDLPTNKEILCEFNSFNKECIQKKCPFYD